MGEDQTDTYIYHKIEPHYSTKTEGEGQTDIYYKIEQLDPTKAKGKDQTDTYIYTIRLNNMTPLNQRGRSEGHIYILRGRSDGQIYIL